MCYYYQTVPVINKWVTMRSLVSTINTCYESEGCITSETVSRRMDHVLTDRWCFQTNRLHTKLQCFIRVAWRVLQDILSSQNIWKHVYPGTVIYVYRINSFMRSPVYRVSPLYHLQMTEHSWRLDFNICIAFFNMQWCGFYTWIKCRFRVKVR